MNEKDIIYRLSFRAGYLAGLGWPFNWFVRDDINLHREATAEIMVLRAKLEEFRT